MRVVTLVFAWYLTGDSRRSNVSVPPNVHLAHHYRHQLTSQETSAPTMKKLFTRKRSQQREQQRKQEENMRNEIDVLHGRSATSDTAAALTSTSSGRDSKSADLSHGLGIASLDINGSSITNAEAQQHHEHDLINDNLKSAEEEYYERENGHDVAIGEKKKKSSRKHHKKHKHHSKEGRSYRAHRSSHRRGDCHDNEEEIAAAERRSRRHKSQEEEDRRPKEQISEQNCAAGDLRKRGDYNDDGEQRQRMTTKPHKYNKKISCEQEEEKQEELPHEEVQSSDDDDEQEKQRQIQQQNLIDLHMAQYLRASRQIPGNFDPSQLDYNSQEENDDNSNTSSSNIFDEYDPTAPLSQFEQSERKRNIIRSQSSRFSDTKIKINAWHQKYTLRKALDLAEKSPEMEWLTSFYRCDPRWQIMKFFDEVAREVSECSCILA